MDVRKQALIAGGIMAVIVRLSIDIVKAAIWCALAYLGWWLFHSHFAWYWSVVGVAMMISGLNALLPLIDIPISFVVMFLVLTHPEEFDK